MTVLSRLSLSTNLPSGVGFNDLDFLFIVFLHAGGVTTPSVFSSVQNLPCSVAYTGVSLAAHAVSLGRDECNLLSDFSSRKHRMVVARPTAPESCLLVEPISLLTMASSTTLESRKFSITPEGSPSLAKAISLLTLAYSLTGDPGTSESRRLSTAPESSALLAKPLSFWLDAITLGIRLLDRSLRSGSLLGSGNSASGSRANLFRTVVGSCFAPCCAAEL